MSRFDIAAPTEVLKGIAASHGVVIASAVVVGRDKIAYRRHHIGGDDIQAEWERFVNAVGDVQRDLRDKMTGLGQRRAEASILEAYELMVGDETLADAVRGEVQNERRCADWAVAVSIKKLAARLGSVDDPYMRERSHDIEFVGDLLLRSLGGVKRASNLVFAEPSIIVAYDLSPADTAAMLDQPVLGFITEVGSRTSHTSIMARALEIPAVVGVKDALASIGSGDMLVLDGFRGRVLVEPTPREIEEAATHAARYDAMSRQLNEKRDLPAKTKDGVVISLLANVELPEEAQMAVDHGAEGVGLYRTEFLYVNREEPPTEEQQLAIFERVINAMNGRPVTLRTFDIGGDKFVSSFKLPEELNPMLGLRAIRLALTEHEVFMTQLRAMLRASALGPIQIMIPLVASLDELRAVRTLLAQARDQVRDAGNSLADQVSLGVMIEVPAAAMMADLFAAEADFMSIGTNDLVQYALAIDRTNRALAYLASPYDPAILRMIARVIAAGEEHDCPVSVCGEMASELYGCLLLAGLGVRNLSMESVAIPEVKETLGRVTHHELLGMAGEALTMSTAAEVESMLERRLERRLHDLLTGQPDSIPGSARRPTPAFGIPRVVLSEPGEDESLSQK